MKANLAGATEPERFAFPYPDMEEHLKANGYAEVYARYRKNQKTKAAADVAIEMEGRGAAGVTREIRDVLERVLSLSRGGWQ